MIHFFLHFCALSPYSSSWSVRKITTSNSEENMTMFFLSRYFFANVFLIVRKVACEIYSLLMLWTVGSFDKHSRHWLFRQDHLRLLSCCLLHISSSSSPSSSSSSSSWTSSSSSPVSEGASNCTSMFIDNRQCPTRSEIYCWKKRELSIYSKSKPKLCPTGGPSFCIQQLPFWDLIAFSPHLLLDTHPFSCSFPL